MGRMAFAGALALLVTVVAPVLANDYGGWQTTGNYSGIRGNLRQYATSTVSGGVVFVWINLCARNNCQQWVQTGTYQGSLPEDHLQEACTYITRMLIHAAPITSRTSGLLQLRTTSINLSTTALAHVPSRVQMVCRSRGILMSIEKVQAAVPRISLGCCRRRTVLRWQRRRSKAIRPSALPISAAQMIAVVTPRMR